MVWNTLCHHSQIIQALVKNYMIEKIEGYPLIETRYGGPALADEVYNELLILTDKINELVEAVNKLEAYIKTKDLPEGVIRNLH